MTLEANPVKLAQLAQDITTISGDARDDLATSRETGLIDSSAFGNISNASEISNSYSNVYDKGGAAVEELAEVLEGDIDRVLRMAFHFQAQDQSNSDNMPQPEG